MFQLLLFESGITKCLKDSLRYKYDGEQAGYHDLVKAVRSVEKEEENATAAHSQGTRDPKPRKGGLLSIPPHAMNPHSMASHMVAPAPEEGEAPPSSPQPQGQGESGTEPGPAPEALDRLDDLVAHLKASFTGPRPGSKGSTPRTGTQPYPGQGGSQYRTGTSRPGPVRDHDGRPMQCYRCHGYGHLAKDCSTPCDIDLNEVTGAPTGGSAPAPTPKPSQ